MAEVSKESSVGGRVISTAENNVRELNVPILMYHNINPVIAPRDSPMHMPSLSFDRQLDLLARHGFTTITFERLFEVISGGKPAPKRMVVLTFDDAYESFYEFVFPALSARKMTGTVFVVANEIGGFNRWDTVCGARRLPLMTEAQLREVAAGGIEIGAHGWAHRHLPQCSENELHEEIFGSKTAIEQRLGKPVRFFCYPYGEYTPAMFSLLKEAAYLGAAAFQTDQERVTSERYALRRISIIPRDVGLRFRLKLTGWFLRYCARRERQLIPPALTL